MLAALAGAPACSSGDPATSSTSGDAGTSHPDAGRPDVISVDVYALAIAASGSSPTLFLATRNFDDASGGLFRIDTSDGKSETISSEGPAEFVTVQNGYVYWYADQYVVSGSSASYQERILRAPVAGGKEEVLAAQDVAEASFAVDAENVYYATKDASVIAQPLAGGAPVVLVPAMIGAKPRVFGVQAGVLYFYGIGTDDSLGVFSMPVTGGTPKLIAPNAPLLYAFGAQTLYFSELNSSEIDVVSLVGGTPHKVADASPGHAIQSIVTDADYVYFTDGSVIAKVPIAGDGAQETLLTTAGNPLSIALTSDSVYWLDQGGMHPTVNRLDK